MEKRVSVPRWGSWLEHSKAFVPAGGQVLAAVAGVQCALISSGTRPFQECSALSGSHTLRAAVCSLYLLSEV